MIWISSRNSFRSKIKKIISSFCPKMSVLFSPRFTRFTFWETRNLFLFSPEKTQHDYAPKKVKYPSFRTIMTLNVVWISLLHSLRSVASQARVILLVLRALRTIISSYFRCKYHRVVSCPYSNYPVRIMISQSMFI